MPYLKCTACHAHGYGTPEYIRLNEGETLESTEETTGAIYYLSDSTSAQIDVAIATEHFNHLLSTILTGNSPDWISIRTDGVEYLSDKKIKTKKRTLSFIPL